MASGRKGDGADRRYFNRSSNVRRNNVVSIIMAGRCAFRLYPTPGCELSALQTDNTETILTIGTTVTAKCNLEPTSVTGRRP